MTLADPPKSDNNHFFLALPYSDTIDDSPNLEIAEYAMDMMMVGTIKTIVNM